MGGNDANSSADFQRNRVAFGQRKWLAAGKTADEIVELIYLTTVSRRGTQQERTLIAEHLKTPPDGQIGLFDLKFELLNSNEFMLRH